MHPRHRNPGNGYRSNSMGMGGMHPEGSARGHGFYNSEYRGFNRGFGRGQGQPKSFHQPPAPPTPRKGDIFMEAGRLAAEYLVSQGMLPPSVLSGKWQNGIFKSQDGDMHLPLEGRSSALNRLGNSGTDVGSGRRRYSDDYNSMGLRNYLKGRRKGGSFRSYGSDWGREYGRSGSWSERSRISPDMEVDDDSYSRHQEDQQVGKDVANSFQRSNSNEFALKSEEAGSSEPELEKYNFQDEMSSRAGSCSVAKDLLHEADAVFSKRSEDSKNMDMETGELRDGTDEDETAKPDTNEDSSTEFHAAEGDDTMGNGNTNLLKFCKFAKVPTRTRSSLTYKGIKVDSVSNNDEENTLDVKLPQGSKVSVEDESLGSSAVDAPSNKTHDYPNLEISKGLPVQSVEGAGALAAVAGPEQGKCMRSQSFPDRALMHVPEQELGQGLLGFQKSNSMGKERGDKRPMEENDSSEGTKKPREWFPSFTIRPGECFNMSTLSEKKESSQEETAAPCEKVSLAIDQGSSVDNYQFSKGGVEPCVGYAQEKQLLPSSFKICDLNLMEDMNDNHHSDPSLTYPAIPKKEATPVDVDLSMSNSNMSGEYSKRISDGKAIEIIDLENDSAQEEDKATDNSDRKTEAMFTSLEGFSNQAPNAGHIPDVQDNYEGLMMTQFFNTFSDCPAVPVDINPLQNEMGLHNGEGNLGDDDSIYMSLGEIPLSFLPPWEQPPQPREF